MSPIHYTKSRIEITDIDDIGHRNNNDDGHGNFLTVVLAGHGFFSKLCFYQLLGTKEILCVPLLSTEA